MYMWCGTDLENTKSHSIVDIEHSILVCLLLSDSDGSILPRLYRMAVEEIEACDRALLV
jgi:hypothetical protein